MDIFLYYTRYPDFAVIYVEGEVEGYHQVDFMKPFEELDTIGCYNYIVNFEGARFLSSSIIGTLIQVWKQAQEQGGELVMCTPNKTIERLIRITNLHSMIRTFDTEREARKVFKKEERQK